MKLNRFSTFIAGTIVATFAHEVAEGRELAASVSAAFIAYYAAMLFLEWREKRRSMHVF